jgi:hypothetical protein
MGSAEQSIGDSSSDFMRLVWPIVGRWAGGSEIFPVEVASEMAFARLLDVQAGIDAWQLVEGQGVQGIASRIQYGAVWKSFTVRERRASGGETELAKRLRALKDVDGHWALPAWTVQAYVEEPRVGDLLYVCMTRTPDLYSYVESKLHELERRRNPDDGNEFIVVWANDLQQAGAEVWEWELDDDQSAGGDVSEVMLQMNAGWHSVCPACGLDHEGGSPICRSCGYPVFN